MKILIMGLPGSGKTWLAERLQKRLECAWFNADEVRRMASDWEFGDDARLRQARRMRDLANFEKGKGRIVICDFVCPTDLTRHIFEADYTVWMDTITKGRFEDTNKMFERPFGTGVDYIVTQWFNDTDERLADAVARHVRMKHDV
jgi:adenylylsulfate kinase